VEVGLAPRRLPFSVLVASRTAWRPYLLDHIGPLIGGIPHLNTSPEFEWEASLPVL
jgi:hypothetical protein